MLWYFVTLGRLNILDVFLIEFKLVWCFLLSLCFFIAESPPLQSSPHALQWKNKGPLLLWFIYDLKAGSFSQAYRYFCSLWDIFDFFACEKPELPEVEGPFSPAFQVSSSISSEDMISYTATIMKAQLRDYIYIIL